MPSTRSATAGPSTCCRTAEQVRASTDGRHIHLITENSANQAGWLKRREDGTPGLYTAQWTDDMHHTLHTAVTGEGFWYYADFVGRLDLLARALAEGLGWQGEYMEYEAQCKGEPSAFLPATAFVSYIQNHDQVGNRPRGERLTSLVPPAAYRMMAAIILLSPQIPMLFMGEEWAAREPFLFFSDLQSLCDKIRQARFDELKDAPGCGPEAPDPMDEETFRASKLRWDALAGETNRKQLSLYRRLIGIRREHIVPRLAGMQGHSGRHEMIGTHGISVAWTLGDGSELKLMANPSSEPLVGVQVWNGDHLWLEGFASGETLDPWSVVFSLKPPVPPSE